MSGSLFVIAEESVCENTCLTGKYFICGALLMFVFLLDSNEIYFAGNREMKIVFNSSVKIVSR